MREANPDAGVEEDYCREVEKLTSEVNELRTLLHEVQENEAKATEDAKTEIRDQQVRIADLKEKCQQAEQECGRLTKELVELQTLRSREAEDSSERCRRAQEKSKQVEHELARVQLDHYCQLEAERRKWEGPEERFLNELKEAHRHTSELWNSSRDHAGSRSKTGAVDATATPGVGETNRASIGVELPDPVSLAPADSSLRQRTSSPAVTQPRLDGAESSSLAPFNSGLLWAAPMLAHQLPPIQQFTGEDTTESGETFEDWIGLLEMITSIRGWDEWTKLVNLTTHLRGQAYAFTSRAQNRNGRTIRLW